MFETVYAKKKIRHKPLYTVGFSPYDRKMEAVQSRALSLRTAKAIFADYGPITISFFLPFFLHDSQFVTGTLVNFLLFIAAVHFSKRNQLAVIFAPSLGTLSRNLIFGTATRSILFFLPFVWLGNYLLIYVFSALRLKTKPMYAVGAAALAKSSVLSLTARSLVRNSFVPRLFIEVMGLNQLITATLGGLLACLFVLCSNKLHVKPKS